MNKDIKKYYQNVSDRLNFKRKRYKVLVVDPPWNQGKTGLRDVRPNQTKTLDYKTLSKKELFDLPIPEWSQKNSLIWLWVTNSKDKKTKQPIIEIGFELLREWGFKYYTTITWDKSTGPCPFGPYQITTEHILFGYKGKSEFSSGTMGKMKTSFTAKSTFHSVKPNVFYELIKKNFKGPRLDVFGREKRVGFDGWGDEYNKIISSNKYK